MRLKSLEIVGFKSFADRVAIDLSGNVTAFVGPNGCGKSNVIDAVKWVLGEQRVSALRGDRMHDVIFNGNASGRRAPMNFAEVSLTLANACGTLAVPFEEVVVTRRLFRSGESEYLLNRSPVRLKDIKKLFMNTGLGVDAYSIMEQGKIDGILEANPRDRRAIFEEAAGISLFKAQRKEAERKLERTQENLLRLGDIIDEIEKRIRSLKQQAGRARTYLALVERIKELRKSYFLRLYADLAVRTEALDERMAVLAEAGGKARAELAARKTARDAIAAGMAAVKDAAYSRRSRLAEIKAALEECDGKIALLERRRTEIGAELAEIAKRDAALRDRRAEREREDAALAERLAEIAGAEAGLQAEEQRVRTNRDELAAKLESCLAEIEELENLIVDLSRKEVQVGNKIVEARERMKGLHAARFRLVQKQHECSRDLFAARAEAKGFLAALAEADERAKGLGADLAAGRDRQARIEAGLAELEQEIRSSDAEVVKTESRIDLLESLLSRREGVAAGARAVLEEAGRRGAGLRCVQGLLGELLDADFACSRSVEAVLGDLAEAVVVENRSEVLEVLAFLKERGLNGVTVLALAELGGAQGDSGPAPWSLAARVDCSERLRRARNALLGTVTLVEADGLFAGAAAEPGLPAGAPRVNLAGDFYRDGVLRVGGRGAEPGTIARRSEVAALKRDLALLRENNDVLQRRRDSVRAALRAVQDANAGLAAGLEEQEFQVASLTAEYEKTVDRLHRLFSELKLHREEGWDADKSLASLGKELRELDAEKAAIGEEIRVESRSLDVAGTRARGFRDEASRLDEAIKSLEIRVVELRGRRGALETEKARVAQSLTETRGQLEELAGDRQRLAASCGATEREIEGLKERTAVMASERSVLGAEVEEVNQRLEALHHQLAAEEDAVARAGAAAEDSRGQLDGLRMELTELQVKRQSLIDRACEEVEIDLVAAAARQAAEAVSAASAAAGEGEQEALRTMDLAALEREIAESRERIARIGNVNLEAVSELEGVEQRYELLVAQRADVHAAQKSLLEMIGELNRESRERFAETFDLVRSHFNTIFRKLFHGGRADIRVNPDEDLLEAGIEVIAGPPRKDVRSISLLSGGERTLTAVALLFALFKARPSPFCLLDEVDAALDETNIDRFCSLLGEFITDSQFVIVTHSKRTMSRADVLYGVTMPVGGVSSFVSLRLEEYAESVA